MPDGPFGVHREEFFNFLIARHQGAMPELTDYVVEPLLSRWRQWLPSARNSLPAARDYLAASLWRRIRYSL